MSKLNKRTVGDSIDCNTVIKRLKENPKIGMFLPSIALKDVVWACIQDVSRRDTGEGHSQAGFIVGVTTKDLWEHKKAPYGNLIVQVTRIEAKGALFFSS